MWPCIKNSLQRAEESWSLGSFGVIAEFSWDEGEKTSQLDGERIGHVTERGGIGCDLSQGVQTIAYETLKKDAETWGQAIAFCQPVEQAKRAGRRVITELGPDKAALLAAHRHHILFDLGLGVSFADFCVRSDDETLIKQLRSACGSRLLATDNRIMPLLLQASPHRVFKTNLARIEVYQPIGVEKSPEGPHTHLLPKLIAQNRAFSANTPIRHDLLPLLTLHAANPCRDTQGHRKPFDITQHERFQALMARWGIDDYQQQKAMTFAALKAGGNMTEFKRGDSRIARLATRIAIRQYQHLYPDCDVLAWQRAFDSAGSEGRLGQQR